MFFITSPMTGDSGLQRLALSTWRNLSQFEFELRTELRRLGGLEPRPASFENVPRDPARAALDCKISIETLLRKYEESFTTTLSAHARAMLNRQFEEVQKHHAALLRLQAAA
jgi:hypothetical protein